MTPPPHPSLAVFSLLSETIRKGDPQINLGLTISHYLEILAGYDESQINQDYNFSPSDLEGAQMLVGYAYIRAAGLQLPLTLAEIEAERTIRIAQRRIERKQGRRRGSARPPIPADIRWRIFERDNFTCVDCGSRADLTVDHMQPYSLGGTLDDGNLQTLCRSCNSRKGARE